MKHTTLNQGYSARLRPLFGPDSICPAPVDHPKCEDDTGTGTKKKGRIRNKNRKGRSEKSENITKKTERGGTINRVFVSRKHRSCPLFGVSTGFRCSTLGSVGGRGGGGLGGLVWEGVVGCLGGLTCWMVHECAGQKRSGPNAVSAKSCRAKGCPFFFWPRKSQKSCNTQRSLRSSKLTPRLGSGPPPPRLSEAWNRLRPRSTFAPTRRGRKP